ncbi:MAG: DEAD/DEAH box helicase [Oligoflexia bacterium]|nr:DEAD/DEAH box helicase [Oligoflexia bacterium]
MSIPHLLEGGDVLGIAQTGTGKTAAFSLPILHRLKVNKKKTKPARMRCLILTPTRELAAQIEENVKLYGKGLALSSTVIFGGVKSRPQITQLKKGTDIIIATPGRFLELMGEGYILFDQLETFVLDEADRMLDMGFIHDVKKIISKLPKKRQTLLFSATMPSDIAELSKKLLKDPKRVEVTPESTTVEKIDQRINLVERTNKPHLLRSILQDKKIKHVLVFTRTKHGANRVVEHLEKVNIEAAAIHGNKSQNARERALNGFKKGKIRVLVATDIAARGIDIASITHVINYNLPDDPKSYVHRIGRTARAGRKGVAISFCDPNELKLLKEIEKTIKMSIPIDETHEFHGVPAKKQNHQPRPKNIKKKKTRRRR